MSKLGIVVYVVRFFFSGRRRHTRWPRDWSSDVCSSDLSLRLNVKQAGPFRRKERGHMHAIGDIADRVLVGGNLRPDTAFHLRRDTAVYATYAIVKARASEPECRHVKAIAVGGSP